ncbi:hypothetical protein C356_01035 [Cryptococcus neoformans c45]|nr:hypothetical protein C356_01035 [Cryptococcus neoformans var. grubii c45]
MSVTTFPPLKERWRIIEKYFKIVELDNGMFCNDYRVSIPPIEYDEFQKSSQFIEGVSTIFGKDNPLEGK